MIDKQTTTSLPVPVLLEGGDKSSNDLDLTKNNTRTSHKKRLSQRAAADDAIVSASVTVATATTTSTTTAIVPYGSNHHQHHLYNNKANHSEGCCFIGEEKISKTNGFIGENNNANDIINETSGRRDVTTTTALTSTSETSSSLSSHTPSKISTTKNTISSKNEVSCTIKNKENQRNGMTSSRTGSSDTGGDLGGGSTTNGNINTNNTTSSKSRRHPKLTTNGATTRMHHPSSFSSSNNSSLSLKNHSSDLDTFCNGHPLSSLTLKKTIPPSTAVVGTMIENKKRPSEAAVAVTVSGQQQKQLPKTKKGKRSVSLANFITTMIHPISTATIDNKSSTIITSGGNRKIVTLLAPRGSMKVQLRKYMQGHDDPYFADKKSVFIRKVLPDSPLLGKLHKDDVLLSMDGNNVTFREIEEYTKQTKHRSRLLEVSRLMVQEASGEEAETDLKASTTNTMMPNDVTKNSDPIQPPPVKKTGPAKKMLLQRRIISSPTASSDNQRKKMRPAITSINATVAEMAFPLISSVEDLSCSLQQKPSHDGARSGTAPTTEMSKLLNTDLFSTSMNAAGSSDRKERQQPAKAINVPTQIKERGNHNASAAAGPAAEVTTKNIEKIDTPHSLPITLEHNNKTLPSTFATTLPAKVLKLPGICDTQQNTKVPFTSRNILERHSVFDFPSCEDDEDDENGGKLQTTANNGKRVLPIHPAMLQTAKVGRSNTSSNRISDLEPRSTLFGRTNDTSKSVTTTVPPKIHNANSEGIGRAKNLAPKASNINMSNKTGHNQRQWAGQQTTEGTTEEKDKWPTRSFIPVNVNVPAQTQRRKRPATKSIVWNKYYANRHVTSASKVTSGAAEPFNYPHVALGATGPEDMKFSGLTTEESTSPEQHRKSKTRVLAPQPVFDVTPVAGTEETSSSQGHSNNENVLVLPRKSDPSITTAMGLGDTIASRITRLQPDTLDFSFSLVDKNSSIDGDEEEWAEEFVFPRNYPEHRDTAISDPQLSSTTNTVGGVKRKRERKPKLTDSSNKGTVSRTNSKNKMVKKKKKRGPERPRKDGDTKEKKKRSQPTKTITTTTTTTLKNIKQSSSINETKKFLSSVNHRSNEEGLLLNRLETQEFKDQRLVVGSTVYAAWPGENPPEEGTFCLSFLFSSCPFSTCILLSTFENDLHLHSLILSHFFSLHIMHNYSLVLGCCQR